MLYNFEYGALLHSGVHSGGPCHMSRLPYGGGSCPPWGVQLFYMTCLATYLCELFVISLANYPTAAMLAKVSLYNFVDSYV